MDKCTRPYSGLFNPGFTNISNQWTSFLVNSEHLNEKDDTLLINLNTSKIDNLIHTTTYIPNIETYITSSSPTCMQLLTQSYTSFIKCLYKFWYQPTLYAEYEDYNMYDSDNDEEPTTASTSSTLAFTAIPLYPTPYYRFAPPQTTVPIPYGYPLDYNSTRTEKHITYHDYYLTGFPNFPTFGNFCWVHCTPNNTAMISNLSSFLTSEQFFSKTSKTLSPSDFNRQQRLPLLYLLTHTRTSHLGIIILKHS